MHVRINQTHARKYIYEIKKVHAKKYVHAKLIHVHVKIEHVHAMECMYDAKICARNGMHV